MYELTRRWVKAGHQVTVVSAPYEKSDIRASGFISEQEVEGVRLIVINTADSNRLSFFRRAVNAMRFAMASCRIALKEPCDVIIASSGPITVGIPALVAKWFRGKKMVFEIRDLWPQGAVELRKLKNPVVIKLAWWFEKLCYQNSSLVVACSPGMEESINKRYPEVPTTVLSNASDVELFGDDNQGVKPALENWQGKHVFVYAGSLGLMDHGSLMVDAMRIISRNDIQLVVIGDGAERKFLEEEIQKSKLDTIIFLGLLPKRDIVQYLRSATASLVLFKNIPMLQTSSPNKLFDAFAAGIPVIHNTTGWIKKLTDETGCGMAVGPDDSRALANAMEFLASDPAKRNSMAMESKKLGLGEFNRDRLAAKYLEKLIGIYHLPISFVGTSDR